MNRVIIRGLLGAAAGIAMVSGAQAADMPVKAKAVEYVKICSAYGAGFYYIPGTDICLRVGGYVYTEYSVKGDSLTPNITSTNGLQRIDADYNYTGFRTSGRVILDARQNTAYGILRATLSTGTTRTNATNAAGWDYAYIQFAGFTWGFTDTFFSFARPGYGVSASFATDWLWTNLLAYTAQLGNGLTASLSFEEPTARRSAIIAGAGAAGAAYGGRWAPDIVGNINVTQAWGRAQVMAALHQVKVNPAALGVGADHEWGWAVGAGIELKTPQTGNPNNSFILQAAYTEGATSYTGLDGGAGGTATLAIQNWAGTGPVYAMQDAIVTPGSTHLVEAWSVYGAYRHYWTPMLRTAFGLGYGEIDGGPLNAASPGNLELLQVGVSTVWSPVSGLDLSLDVVWSDIEQTNFGGLAGSSRSNDLLSALVRLRRNF